MKIQQTNNMFGGRPSPGQTQNNNLQQSAQNSLEYYKDIFGPGQAPPQHQDYLRRLQLAATDPQAARLEGFKLQQEAQRGGGFGQDGGDGGFVVGAMPRGLQTRITTGTRQGGTAPGLGAGKFTKDPVGLQSSTPFAQAQAQVPKQFLGGTPGFNPLKMLKL